MTDKLLADISKKLNVLIALTLRGKVEDSVFQVTGKKKGIGQQVRFFGELGFGCEGDRRNRRVARHKRSHSPHSHQKEMT